MSSVCLNGILDLSDRKVYKSVKKTLDIDQLNWLEKVIIKKNSPNLHNILSNLLRIHVLEPRFEQFLCPRRFDPCYYERTMSPNKY